MRLAWTVLFLSLAVGSAAAQPKAQIDRWFQDLSKAGSADEAKPIEDKIETAFRQSGSPSVDLLMTRAKEAVSAADTKTATTLIGSVTRLAPNYAEGWRLRATLEAAGGNDGAAMLSLQRAVTINPRHFSAMADLAGMLEDYGDKKAALTLYRKVLTLYPRHEAANNRVRALERDVEGQGI
jgi:tetratricopeptide (TPR) repeat protein